MELSHDEYPYKNNPAFEKIFISHLCICAAVLSFIPNQHHIHNALVLYDDHYVTLLKQASLAGIACFE